MVRNDGRPLAGPSGRGPSGPHVGGAAVRRTRECEVQLPLTGVDVVPAVAPLPLADVEPAADPTE